MTAPQFYPDRISATANDVVSIAANGDVGTCTLKVTRLGAQAEQLARISDIAVQPAATPATPDTNGCDWPEVARFTVDPQWPSGYYDLHLESATGAGSHHFICVRRAPDAQHSRACVVLTTNTYAAYNYWGGANSYAHVEKQLSGVFTPAEAQDHAIGRLSWRRPLAQGMFAPEEDMPRLINEGQRGYRNRPRPQGLDWLKQNRPSPYDGAAGFVNKWEHKFVAWAEDQGYQFDYLTDFDFERDADALQGYDCVLLVGHSEYWSANGRNQVDAFVQSGGNLAVFSGNTCYWKVRWEQDATMVAHKWRGETDDPLWADPNTRTQATHLWSHDAFEQPEASTFGLSFLYGGYHRLAMCVARGAGAYTVYDDTHWSLEGTDLFYGDQLGSTVPLLGYENDGCPIEFDNRGLPVPGDGRGVPPHFEIVAMAPATLAESARSEFDPVIPPERPETLATFAYGDPGPTSVQRLMRGHAVMGSFKHGQGEVFNAGTTEWAHGLAAKDPFIEKITQNVLRRFNAI